MLHLLRKRFFTPQLGLGRQVTAGSSITSLVEVKIRREEEGNAGVACVECSQAEVLRATHTQCQCLSLPVQFGINGLAKQKSSRWGPQCHLHY